MKAIFIEGLGPAIFGTIIQKKRIYFEAQFFNKIRDFSDGITFFKFYINLDLYKHDHSPSFQIELEFFNLYSQFMIYQNNSQNAYRDIDTVYETDKS